MTRHLIILMGNHRVIRPIAEKTVKNFHNIFYYKSLEDNLRARFEQVSPTANEHLDKLLMQEEFTRDEIILSNLSQDDTCILVEQWHFGNLARVRLRSPEITRIYEAKLAQQLSNFEGIDKQVFYISMFDDDILLPTTSDAELSSLHDELHQLIAIFRQQKIQLETIDGSALPEYLEKRFLYLLKPKLSTT